LFKKDRKTSSRGVYITQQGDPQEVMKAHALRGFAMLSEATLGTVIESKGGEIPEQEDKNVDRKVDLQMACMAAVEPEWDEERAAQSLHRGFVMEHPDTYENLKIPPKMVAEVVTPSEAKEVEKFASALSQVRARKEHMKSTRALQSKKYFRRAPAPRWKADLKNMPRWLPKRNPAILDVSAWIKRHIPETVDIVTDESHGRWQLIPSTLKPKCISWTRRGWRAAAFEVIHQAWNFHQDGSSHPPPFDINLLSAEYEGEAIPDL
jgi:hypothetical protein